MPTIDDVIATIEKATEAKRSGDYLGAMNLMAEANERLLDEVKRLATALTAVVNTGLAALPEEVTNTLAKRQGPA